MRLESLRSVCSDQRYRLDELPSVHRLLDGVEVEHRGPRRSNPLHCGRRVVSRIGLSGHELLLEFDRLADFPCHPGAVVGLFADDAQKMTGVTYARGEVLFDGDRLLAVGRDVEGTVVRREIEFLVGIPPKQPILGSLVIVIIVADEHLILSHLPFPFVDGLPVKDLHVPGAFLRKATKPPSKMPSKFHAPGELKFERLSA